MITKTSNQDNPLSQGLVPIFVIDVWEHAYYLHYQNRRADYLEAIWNVVNWDRVGAYYGLIQLAGGIAELTSWAEAQWGKVEETLGKILD